MMGHCPKPETSNLADESVMFNVALNPINPKDPKAHNRLMKVQGFQSFPWPLPREGASTEVLK